MKELGRHVVIFVLTLVFSAVIKNTVFDQEKQLDTDDFSMVENTIAVDQTHQIKTFFLKNNSSYPINNSNVSLEYSSNFTPINANFTNSKDEFLPIKISSNPKSIFDLDLPIKLRNENFFSISIHYKLSQTINDKLSLKIQNSDDTEYITLLSENRTIDNFIDNTKQTFYYGKSLLLAETFIILYAIFYSLTRLASLCMEIYKRHQDEKFIDSSGKKQFIKKK